MVFLPSTSSEVGEQSPVRVIPAPADRAGERRLAPRRWEKDAGTGTRALSRDGEPGGGRPTVTAGIATVRRGAPSPRPPENPARGPPLPQF